MGLLDNAIPVEITQSVFVQKKSTTVVVPFLYLMMLAMALLQLPPFRFIDAFRYVAIGTCVLSFFWILLTIVVINRIQFTGSFKIGVIFYLYFLLYPLTLEIFSGYSYLSSPIFYNINASAFIFAMGYLLAQLLPLHFFKKLLYCFVLLLLTFLPYLYLSGYIGFDSYYSSKNSLGPLFVIAAVIFFNFAMEGRAFARFFNICAGLAFTASVFIISNRASMVSLITLLGYFLLTKHLRMKTKIIIASLLGFFSVFIFFSHKYLMIFKNLTMLDLLDNGMDDFSRGRLYQIEEAIRVIADNPIFGVGNMFVENFQLSTVIQYGLLFAFPFFIFYISIIYKFIISVKRECSLLERTFSCLLIHGTVISFFEEQAPLGPGATYFPLWFLFGAMVTLTTKLPNSLRHPQHR